MKLRIRRLSVIGIALVGVLVWLVVNPESYDELFTVIENDGAESGLNESADESSKKAQNESADESSEKAVDILDKIDVKGRAPKKGYSREEFYDGWPMVDGCSLRQRIIKREFGEKAVLDGCNVVAGEFIVNIVATDESNNISKKEIKLVITEPPRPVARTTSNGSPYYIEVNRQQNVVIVYSKDQNGNYTNVSKVFVASTGAPGSETPLGTFTVTDRYESLFLVGNVWGHYTLRINGPIFFHSVPYFTKGAPWDNLEYLEYNKLGNGASAGCVRLAAADAKWIYDNIAYGTTVKIYDSPNLPTGVTKPSAITIDINSPNRGWDPTDPDPNNPWH